MNERPTDLDIVRVNALLADGAPETGADAQLSWRVVYQREVSSTMDVARALAERGEPAGAVAVADEQTAGRGRLGRSWVSAAGGNLYFTVLLRPTLAGLRQLAMIAPLAVVEGIGDVTGLHAEIKWPNDVQLDGLKCCGVLIDADVRGDAPALALVGIGLNVNVDPAQTPELSGIATCLRVALGRSVEREAVLAAVLGRLAELLALVERGESARPRWRARLNTLGRAVRVRIGAEIETGVVVDVAEDGSLELERADGSRILIAAGEVTLRA